MMGAWAHHQRAEQKEWIGKYSPLSKDLPSYFSVFTGAAGLPVQVLEIGALSRRVSAQSPMASEPCKR